MSDTYVSFVPVDPFLVPTEAQRAVALDAAQKAIPEAEEYKWSVFPATSFIDCGENLEQIICPACASHLELAHFEEEDPILNWWETVFDNVRTIEGGRYLDIRETDTIVVPCCSQNVRILDLRFDWPAVFGRCVLSIMNPDAEHPLPAEAVARIADGLGCGVHEIWAHY